MGIRISSDSLINQSQQTNNNPSTNRPTQQPTVQGQSAVENTVIPQGINSRATARNSENLSASTLRSQLQGIPSLSTLTKDIASAMRPATTGGRDSATADTVIKTATPNLAILDNKTVTSTINVTDNGQADSIKLNLDINHTYRGDLVVKLTSPSGKVATISNKVGGSADNLKLLNLDLSTIFPGESIKGSWKLSVQDTATQDTGTFNSWGLNIIKKPTPGGGGQTGVTNLQVTGTTQFIQRVGQDLAKFAPGTTVDAQGYVHAPTTRTPGHAQGYKLLDDILAGGNGGNKKVTINFTSQNAFTQSGTGAAVVNGRAGVGSDATVSVDSSLAISLPTVIGKTPSGSDIIADRPISSEVVLAHELVHAVHAQRGTIDRSLRDHTFTDNDVTYKENWRYEELRTTGFAGFRQGNEASENSIRAELGFGNRATYLDRSSWTRVSGVAANGISASNARTSSAGGEQLVGDAWRSNGAALPNGQFRICNCFAC
ncbi:MAG: S8A family peptidase [bacterium]|nr:MAG: S8A family peptidase [bacterium]